MNGPDECVPCAGPGARINENGECDCTPQFAEFLEEGTGAQIDLLIIHKSSTLFHFLETNLSLVCYFSFFIGGAMRMKNRGGEECVKNLGKRETFCS